MIEFAPAAARDKIDMGFSIGTLTRGKLQAEFKITEAINNREEMHAR